MLLCGAIFWYGVTLPRSGQRCRHGVWDYEYQHITNHASVGITTLSAGQAVRPPQCSTTVLLGYQSDSATVLQLLGHRYYDPNVGRFLSSDTAQAGTNW